ncbi:Phosphatidylserine decarboxylase [Arabidopsis thaliana x Arabidopsis arenosa]|uniref:Phosphatidylserine decarboxylase proenzyme 1, mitochondrial n=1 Tax=Arabidopsis thaliana x Arabidopsis arenosa TaxID=1240361 RepID=A0A8T1YBD8_9BRAS|nr:Phosphatidylserine decarboxylase [Arabidopsis thaliana x Arabidopsis arenosa]
MKPRFSHNVYFLARYSHLRRFHHSHRRTFSSFLNNIRANYYGTHASSLGGSSGAGGGGGGTGDSKGNAFLLPGATMATILMLGALHARRLYEDKKIEEKRERGIELEFHPDVKASFLGVLPLRSISRAWGSLMSLEIPVWMRPYAYKAWARAFHSNLEEAALPLKEYASLQDFFVRSLKEGCRPIDPDPCCLVSPVDGTILRFGELKGSRGMIEQVKGHSYSVPALLGNNSLLPMEPEGKDESEEEAVGDKSDKSWLRVSLASPKLRENISASPMKGLYYCVIYLRPGDYHRIHSPVDWNAMVRRHFAGRLFPVNERATRTIRNLYVENERVVLEGIWKEGFMALAAVGATNIGSIELFIEPELRTNKPKKKLFPTEPPEERVYDPEGLGLKLEKGKEVGVFNMGSTVVLVFQAPTANSPEGSSSSSDYRFCVKQGDRVRVGQALGRWNEE